MNIRWRFFGGGVLALVLVAPVGAAQQITLQDAVQRALDRSPTLAQLESQRGNAEAERRTAFGAFLPTLSFSSGASRSSTSRFDTNTSRIVSGNAGSYNAGLSAGYDLFSGGRKFAELGRTKSDLAAAEARVADQRFAVELQTKQLFFGALREAELLEVSRARVERAVESLDMVRRLVQVGTGTRSDTLRARLELTNARQAELRATTNRRAARFALGRQVGTPGQVEPILSQAIDPRPLAIPEDEILLIAESESPAVRASRAAMQAADDAVRSARSAYLPNIRLGSNYNWSNTELSFDNGRTSWNMSLSANYPIFNGFNREASIFRASSSSRVARLQEEDSRLAARQEADGALQDLRTGEQAIELARESVTVAQEDLRVVQERYRLGVAIILDVVTSQVALDQAQADLVTTRYDYALARATLEAIVGRQL